LSTLEKRPRAVHVCPSADPFPPLAEIQAETGRAIQVLASHKVEAWLMTRGYIRPAVLRVIEAQRRWVRITMGLTTLDRGLQRRLEPLAAPPRMRLRQLAQLRARGISVQVALEPLVPGLTDTHSHLTALLEQLAAAEIRHVTAGYMFLRPGFRDHLVGLLEPHGIGDMVLEAFEGGPILRSRSMAAAQYLPKIRRQRGYAALMALAAGLGIRVSVCSLSNPDFGPPRK
jgi:DNA repair photolyase